MSAPLATVLIRTKDEAASIGRTLDLLRAQTIADRLELLVVDSGSRDATVAIAEDRGATVLPIAAEDFSFGYALNYGAERSRGDVVIALSAHAFPSDVCWAERMLEAFRDERVACACGYDSGPRDEPLRERLVQDRALAETAPFWGYSNASGAFRHDLWRERPFREDMPGTEDKEWAWHWLMRGRLVVVDPRLAVEHGHHDEDPLRCFRRARREWEGFALYLELPPYRLSDLARDWWLPDAHADGLRARVSPRRCARLLGRYAGQARGRRRHS